MNYRLLYTTFAIFVLTACGDDDERSCVACNSSQTISFTVCEESDGNASVNGENTGTTYSVYLDGLRDAGATCGE